MLTFNLSLSRYQKEKIEYQMTAAEAKGDLSEVKRLLVILFTGDRLNMEKIVTEFFKLHADRITVFKLPAYSPDYNPIEKLWEKIKRTVIHLKYFQTFDMSKKIQLMICY
jgi:transposase